MVPSTPHSVGLTIIEPPCPGVCPQARIEFTVENHFLLWHRTCKQVDLVTKGPTSLLAAVVQSSKTWVSG
jgi:hypothetical protein